MSEELAAIGKGHVQLDEVENGDLVKHVESFRSNLNKIDFKTLNPESTAALAGLATDLQKAMQSHKDRLAIEKQSKQTNDIFAR